MGGRLVGIVAAAVQVVDVEAEGQALVGIDREVGLEAFLTVLFAAGLVVGQVGKRDVAVGELEVARAEVEARHGCQEHGRPVVCAFEEQARYTRTAQIAQVVVVSFHAFHQVGVLEVQVGSVGRYDGAFAQQFVQLPHVQLGRQALDVYVGTVVQVVRLGRRVYLVAVLVAQGLPASDGSQRLLRLCQARSQQT